MSTSPLIVLVCAGPLVLGLAGLVAAVRARRFRWGPALAASLCLHLGLFLALGARLLPHPPPPAPEPGFLEVPLGFSAGSVIFVDEKGGGAPGGGGASRGWADGAWAEPPRPPGPHALPVPVPDDALSAGQLLRAESPLPARRLTAPGTDLGPGPLPPALTAVAPGPRDLPDFPVPDPGAGAGAPGERARADSPLPARQLTAAGTDLGPGRLPTALTVGTAGPQRIPESSVPDPAGWEGERTLADFALPRLQFRPPGGDPGPKALPAPLTAAAGAPGPPGFGVPDPDPARAPGRAGDAGVVPRTPLQAPVGRLFNPLKSGESVIYLIDQSWSMHGPRLDGVKRELIRLVHESELGAEYEILFFSNDFVSINGGGHQVRLLPKTAGSEAALRERLRTINALLLTEPKEALLAALAARPDKIYLLTDGEISEAELPLAQIARVNGGRTQIFAIEIGEKRPRDPNCRLVKKLADQNGGRYEFVPVRER